MHGGVLLGLLLLPLLSIVAACSDEQLEFFFDIPPPTAEELAVQADEQAAKEREAAASVAMARTAAADQLALEEEREPLPIESVQTWEEAHKLLPKDSFDEVDWTRALRDGLIRPRAGIEGRKTPEHTVFRWDFYFNGPDPSFDAYFPHSTHTEWVACESCHPRIFRNREIEITMDRVIEGEFCGVCHGPVAFTLDNCVRCHTAME